MDKQEVIEALAAEPELLAEALDTQPELRTALKDWLALQLVGPGEINKMVAAKLGEARLRQAVEKLRNHPAFPETIRLRMGEISLRMEVEEFLALERPTGQPGQKVAQAAREAREAASKK